MENVVVFWFRRDLRLDDNTALFHALNSGIPVLPIFIFDPDILSKLPKDDARVTFIYETLDQLNRTLKKQGKAIAIYHGTPLKIFNEILKEHDVSAIYTNHDYEPYAKERDNSIREFSRSRSINFHSFKDQVIFEKNEVVKPNGTPYVVYTPYSKKWLEKYQMTTPKTNTSANMIEHFLTSKDNPQVSLQDLGFTPSKVKVASFHLDSLLIDEYEATRNFPALDQTSKLGTHLRFGTVSIRRIVAKAAKQYNSTFLKELIWREFFMQILWHFPQTTDTCFRPKYERLEWRNNEEEFKKWCEGMTGYPLVDAGMRQLNQTGFMHNRVRMLVGSFLCKHLLIDWRWGEAYFAEKLHDYEMASNVGNWQWVAGCGVDAAPYFRIFNPTTHIQKFDKNLVYIKKWVPEFQEFTYPPPMVEHTFARERCLKMYKEALS
ncbi:deoxyribodipyrimidine photo-lyase [Flavobacteriaceae bacterium S356]|uniref:Deoxyribodipyrimidine photo-lyase n=1 Tax=Asprobacillus argus TaxID=3076534 RepID=A0ABU3LIJ6_9FLAO|nr:deoxyribodipyrimidine photo-lyase [Flavobacteriaceae bacterium S356]